MVVIRVLTILTIVLLLHPVEAAAAVSARKDVEPDVELEQILAIARNWRNSIVNLRVVCDLRSLPDADGPLVDHSPPGNPEAAQQFLKEEWIWADNGLDYYETRVFFWSPGQTGFRTLDVFNGPGGFSFRANYLRKPNSIERFNDLEIQRIIGGKPTSTKARAPMHGLYWPATAEWLPEMLVSGHWVLDGVESVRGTACAKVRNASGSETVWLDIGHDALPRRHHRSGGEAAVDFLVDEFQQLDMGLWFPKSGRIQLLSGGSVETQLFVVTDVQVNSPIDVKRFNVPEPAVGTAVMDGRTGKSFVYGNPAAKADATSATAASQAEVNTASSPSGRSPLIIALVCISVASLAVGFSLRRKGRRS